MSETKASRTLVKSPPELWAECSDATSLTRHLDQFGEIKITRLEPETTVAWEGESASGTVKLEPSGWGTKVTLTAVAAGSSAEEPVAVVPEPVAPPDSMAVEEPEPVAVEPEPEPVAVVEPEPVPAYVPAPAPVRPAEPPPRPARGGLFARLMAIMAPRPAPSAPPAPVAVAPPAPAAPPVPEPTPGPVAVTPTPEPVAVTPSPEPVAVTPTPEPVAVTPTPEPVEPEPSPVSAELADAEAALVAALDSLGQAHHRPFSRA
jgi:hypothetical protein